VISDSVKLRSLIDNWWTCEVWGNHMNNSAILS